MSKLRTALNVTIIAAASLCPQQASAIEEDGDPTGSGSSGAGGVIAAQVQYGRPPAGHGKPDSNGCRWTPIAVLPGPDGTVQDSAREINGVTYHLFIKDCPTSDVAYWIPQTARRPTALAAAAANRVQRLAAAPTVGLQPPPSLQTINIPTWFWTSPASWKPVSVTAWIPTPTGIAWATTTATPAQLRYVPGTGDAAATCDHRGKPTAEANRHLTGRPGDCTFTYTRHATPGNRTVRAELHIIWHVSWTSNVGAGGDLDGFTTSTAVNVDIDEIHALVTN